MALYGKNTLKAIQEGVDKAIPFKCGNVSGRVIRGTIDIGWGRLPEENKQLIRDVLGINKAFVIYSWQTPIAVHNLETDEWVIPDVRYSNSTTGHQHAVRVAVNNPGFYS